MKRYFSVFCAVCLCLFGCKKQETVIQLVMAEVNPADSLSAQMDMAFIQKVDELSDGKIKIQLYTDGTLGDNATVMELVKQENSEVHIARISPATLVNYGCPKQELLDVPYTFSSHEHFQNFLESPAAQEILDEPYQNNIGVKGLFFGQEGFRHFFSTKPLSYIEDFDGKIMRTAGTAVMEGLAHALGSKPVKISFTTLYSALKTGSADIAEQPIQNYYANNFHKVAPYMILDGHQLGLIEVVINAKVWEGLSEQNQSILLEAGAYAAKLSGETVQANENETKNLLASEGVQIVEVGDIAKWQKACADVINSVVQSNTQLYGEIITLAD